MGESIFNREQELAGQPQGALVPGRNGMGVRGVIDPNRTMPGGEGASPALDMSIFGSSQGSGGQLNGYAQNTVKKVLDRVRDLNLYPDGTSRNDQMKSLVGKERYDEIAAKGGDGPRFEKGKMESQEQLVPTVDDRPRTRMATEEEIQERLNSNGPRILNATGQGIVGFVAGSVGGPLGALAGGLSSGVNAYLGGTPSEINEKIKEEMRTKPTMPIFENMTPEEIGSYYGQ